MNWWIVGGGGGGVGGRGGGLSGSGFSGGEGFLKIKMKLFPTTTQVEVPSGSDLRPCQTKVTADQTLPDQSFL